MSKSAKIGDRIKVLKETLGGKSERELEMGGLPGGKWLVSNGLLSKWEDKSVEYKTNKVEKFLNHYKVNRQWWKTGEGPVLMAASDEKPTHGDIPPAIAGKRLGNSHPDIVDILEGRGDYILMHKRLLDNLLNQSEQLIGMKLKSKFSGVKKRKDGA